MDEDSSSGGHLLADAVEAAAFFDEVEAVNAYDLTVGKKASDEGESRLIVFLGKSRNEDSPLDDEEIDVAGG